MFRKYPNRFFKMFYSLKPLQTAFKRLFPGFKQPNNKKQTKNNNNYVYFLEKPIVASENYMWECTAPLPLITKIHLAAHKTFLF